MRSGLRSRSSAHASVQLSKNVRRPLLKQVKGEIREEQRPAPPPPREPVRIEVGLDDSPIGSSDDEAQPLPAAFGRDSNEADSRVSEQKRRTTAERNGRRSDRVHDEPELPAQKHGTNKRRKLEALPDPQDNDELEAWENMFSQSSSQRASKNRNTYARPQNIHAPPAVATTSKSFTKSNDHLAKAKRYGPAFKTPKTLHEGSGAQMANFRKPASFKQPAGEDGETSSQLFPSQDQEDLASSQNPEIASSLLLSQDIPGSTSTIICPVCKGEVDRSFLDSFTDGRRLHVKQAFKFCAAHRRQEALEQWGDRGYPQIDWERFDTRLRRHNKVIESMIQQKRPSHYRTELENKAGTGTFRNAMRNPEAAAEQSIVPGYYGSKGQSRMMQHIVDTFGTKVAKLSAHDTLIAQTTMIGFVQVVLVPELATLLIQEDMRVDAGRAREVMEQSAEIGDLVNPEEVAEMGESGEDDDDDGDKDGEGLEEDDDGDEDD